MEDVVQFIKQRDNKNKKELIDYQIRQNTKFLLMTQKKHNFVLTKNLQCYTSQLNFTRKIVSSELSKYPMRERYLADIQKQEKTVKLIKKQIKELNLSDLQVSQLYGSCFKQIQNSILQILLPFRLQKTDFQFFIEKRQFLQNQTSCGISMKIQTSQYDDRLLTDTNINQILDIQYHHHSLKALAQKATNILKDFQCNKMIETENGGIYQILMQITKNYNVVSYHNFTHAFSVFTMFYQIAKNQKVKIWINQFQLYFCLIACLCHDLKHDGLNTIFQIKSKSQRATDFGYISVLQQMHRSVALQILERQNLNSPLLALNHKDRKYAKQIITNSILATDMSKHYDYISTLQKKQLKSDQIKDRLCVMQSLIHGCDIGNSMLDYNNYIVWANLVCVEFHDQTIHQLQSGLEQTQHMKFQSLNYFYKNQKTFINSVVLPMWNVIANIFNDQQIRAKCKIIKENADKVSEHLRRNSGVQIKTSINKYLSNILTKIK